MKCVLTTVLSVSRVTSFAVNLPIRVIALASYMLEMTILLVEIVYRFTFECSTEIGRLIQMYICVSIQTSPGSGKRPFGSPYSAW